MDDKILNPIRRATTVLGCRVEDRDGEVVGTIDEIVLHVPDGRVAYAMIAFGGMQGLGDKMIAVPWTALSKPPANGEDVFHLDLERSRLGDAPTFDRDHWPDMADVHWCSGVDAWYRRSSGVSATRSRSSGLSGLSGLSGGAG